MDNLFNSNLFSALATILTAVVAISLFYWEQKKKKRDAAKIIVQEIRRAEDIINGFKEFSSYKFTRKIIATNSWAKNIHYFVGDLEQDEIDKISNLYSTGEYLDSIIIKISDYNFDDNIKIHKEKIKQTLNVINSQEQFVNNQSTSNTIPDNKPNENIDILTNIKTKKMVVPIKLNIPAPWQILLDEVSYNLEPIYHSSICEKLKKIAKIG